MFGNNFPAHTHNQYLLSLQEFFLHLKRDFPYKAAELI